MPLWLLDFQRIKPTISSTHWKVAHHQPDDSTGFSATLFESLDNPGHYTFAIRGTRGLTDLLSADYSGIFSLGYARDQIYSLYNYFIRVITPATETVGQWVVTGLTDVDGQLSAVYGYEDAAAPGLGLIVDATGQNTNFDASVQVAGHSLGGHLAFAFSRLFPDWTDGVYTYNAPGIAESAAADNFFRSFGGGGDYPVNLAQLTASLVGEAGRELIAGFNGAPVPEHYVFIEDQGLPGPGNSSGNHSISALTDALAVYNLFGTLDPSLSLEQIKPFLQLASNKNNESLEAAVDALGDLFGVGTKVGIGDRDALYTRIQAIESNLFYQQAGGLVDLVATETLSDAAALDNSDGLAYRYALEHLNAFAITGDDGLYAARNANGELDAARFTEAYLADRAAFLDLKNRLYAQDGDLLTNAGEDVRYEDPALTLEQYKITPGRSSQPPRLVIFDSDEANAALDGDVQGDSLYGRGGDDVLRGKDGSDYLEGGEGDDTLEGGADDDTLRGGRGDDTYRYQTGDGTDTLFDTDGANTLQVNGLTLSGGERIAGERWRDDAQGTEYQLVTTTSGTQTMTIFQDGAGQILRIEDYRPENYGLTFSEGQSLVPPATTRTLVGDYLAMEFPSPVGPTNRKDELGNYILDLTRPQVRDDTLYGSEGSDQILPGEGDDGVYARGGDDLIDGGPGQDGLSGEGGNDTVIGGPDGDLLFGSAGDDRVYADDVQTIADALGASQATFRKGDLLSGNAGNDKLLGNAADDTLFGGEGRDLMIGSAGSDNLVGDLKLTASNVYAWSAARSIHSGPAGTVYELIYDNMEFDTSADGDSDVLFGGFGEDWLFGQAGDDVLDGGEDADALLGGSGKDTLLGGAGDDILVGDAGTTDVGTITHGADYLDGGAGNDYLQGDGGADRLYGGDDADELHGNDDNDRLFGEQGADHLFGGAGDDALDGGTEDDWLQGDDGKDQLYGQAGVDILLGGAGDDTLYGGADGDTLQGGAGGDKLHGDAGDDHLFGEDGNDVLSGGAGLDELRGDAGDDTLVGGDGNDLLDGGDGADTLTGGSGNDRYQADDDDTLVFGPGAGDDLVVMAGTGGRLVFEGVSVAALKVSYATDAAGAFHLRLSCAGSSVDIEDGHIAGGRTYVFDDSVLSHADVMRLAPTLNTPGTDNDDPIAGSDNGDAIAGGLGNDRLAGQGGNDTLIGGPGDDELDGGSGDDVLSGGPGNNVYRVDSAGDAVVEYSGEGFDTVQAAVSYTLGADLEGLELTGRRDTDGAGNALNNEIRGNSAANTLYGEAGQDLVAGRDGDDRLYGGPGDDQVFGDAGQDRLVGESGNDTLFGGLGDDTYVFNLGDGQDVVIDPDGDNVVEFGAGVGSGDLRVERYQSLDGSHYLEVGYGDQGDSIVIRNGSGGAIGTFRFADGTALAPTELLAGNPLPLNLLGSDYADQITGTDSDDIVQALAGDDVVDGGLGDDVLLGGAGNDSLSGGPGADELDGGRGNDLLEGGEGADRYRVYWGMGRDTIADAGPQNNVIVLSAGTSVDDLDVRQDGDDLRVSLKGSQDQMTLQNFSANSATWRLEDASGTTLDLNTLIANGSGADFIANSIQAFRDTARAAYFDGLIQQNFSVTADNELESTVLSGNAANVYVNHYVERYSEQAFASDAAWIERNTAAWASVTTLDAQASSTAAESTVVPGTGGFAGGAGSAQYLPLTQDRSISIADESSVFFVSGAGDGLEPDAPLTDPLSNRRTGVWILDETATAAAAGQGVGFVSSVRREYTQTTDVMLEEIHGGGSDNTILVNGYGVVDAGAGNDTLIAEDFSTRFQSWEDLGFEYGAVLYGNDGDDVLRGGSFSDLLIGGEGDDYLDGAGGEDRYLVTANGTGMDVVYDSGTLPYLVQDEVFPNGFTDYLKWYYRAVQGSKIEDLFPLDYGSLPPAINVNDYQALHDLVDAGVIKKDSVEFESGITQADLTVTWGELALNVSDPYNGRESIGVHRTLDIALPDGHGVRIVIPHTFNIRDGSFEPGELDELRHEVPRHALEIGRGLGLGIEEFRFADGSVLSMLDMIGLAGPTPTFDPQNSDNALVGTDLNDTIDGAGGNDVIEGRAGSDRLRGGPGDDTLNGGDGSDVYEFNRGDGVDTIVDLNSDRDSNYLFLGPGITPGDLVVERDAGGVTLRFGDGADAVHLVSADTASGDAGQVIEALVFYDEQNGDPVIDQSGNFLGTGSIVALGGILPPVVNRFDGTADDDSLSGTVDNNVIAAGGGNDTVDGLAGDDQLAGGAGDDNLNGNGGMDRLAGGEGSDQLTGGADDDRLEGGPGADTLSGNAGNDSLYGGEGADTLNGGQDDDLLFGGADDDRLDGYAGNDQLWGEAGDDLLNGHSGSDLLYGGDGDDQLTGGNDDDQLFGGTGADVLEGNAGDDRMQGDAGNDYLRGGLGDDQLDGGADDDVLEGSGGADVLAGGEGNDILSGQSGSDFLMGAAGDDQLSGGSDDDRLAGGPGADLLDGNDGSDLLYGDDGADTLSGGLGDDELFGGAGADSLLGFAGDDLLFGDLGDDVLKGHAGNDTLVGGAGNDDLYGGADDDFIAGDAGDDALRGHAGNDILNGDAGNDSLWGGTGDDVLAGGAGNDLLDGGRGSDLYRFARGDAGDTLIDVDADPNRDALEFAAGIDHDQLWFTQVNDHLQVQIIGTTDSLTIQNWYRGTERQIEEFDAGDGLILLNSQVDQLVQAMAAFTPPASGELELSVDLHDQLDAVLAANWH